MMQTPASKDAANLKARLSSLQRKDRLDTWSDDDFAAAIEHFQRAIAPYPLYAVDQAQLA